MPAELTKPSQVLTEQIVAADDDDVVVDLVLCDHEVDIADSAELVRVVSAAIVNNGEAEVEIWMLVNFGPSLEMACELCVRHDVPMIDSAN